MNSKLMVVVSGPLALALIGIAGCGQGPSRIQAPGINGSRAASLAMEEYDTDGNGVVSGAELDSAPTLKAALATLDANADGGVSADEIEQRVKAWQQFGTGLTTINCLVEMGGAPLGDAEVTFAPPSYLKDDLPTAVGKTNRFGMVSPSVPKENRPTPETPPGLPLGLYEVRVSKLSGGNETIPAKYNTETTLGQQVSDDDPAVMANNVRFEL